MKNRLTEKTDKYDAAEGERPPPFLQPGIPSSGAINDTYQLSNSMEKIRPPEQLTQQDLFDVADWHGDPKCECGSGKKPDECCHKRSDWHPNQHIKQYRERSDTGRSDGYASNNNADFVEGPGNRELHNEEDVICFVCGRPEKECICGDKGGNEEDSSGGKRSPEMQA